MSALDQEGEVEGEGWNFDILEGYVWPTGGAIINTAFSDKIKTETERYLYKGTDQFSPLPIKFILILNILRKMSLISVAQNYIINI